MDELLQDGGYELSPSSVALLWYMLYHTIYDPGSKIFCHVNPLKSTNRALSKGTLRGERTVRQSLAELEALGFIRREQQFGTNGYQQQNLIKMTTPDDFCWAYRRRGHRRDEECKRQCD